MPALSLDEFVEAFAAKLIESGERTVRLNDPKSRGGLLRIYKMIDSELQKEEAKALPDEDWQISLVNIRNLFAPSPIGSFDDFEAFMREKQVYLTGHPNPYYQDLIYQLPSLAAKELLASLEPATRALVANAAKNYFGTPP